MRRGLSGLLAIAFAAVFVQSPWLHVHDSTADSEHYRSQHAGLSVVHGHDDDHDHDARVPGSRWREHETYGDVHFFGPIKGIRSGVVSLDAFAPVVQYVTTSTTSALIDRRVEFTPRAHGPPGRSTVPPRAPPA